MRPCYGVQACSQVSFFGKPMPGFPACGLSGVPAQSGSDVDRFPGCVGSGYQGWPWCVVGPEFSGPVQCLALRSEYDPAPGSRVSPFQDERPDSPAPVKAGPSKQWLNLQLANSALPLSIISTSSAYSTQRSWIAQRRRARRDARADAGPAGVASKEAGTGIDAFRDCWNGAKAVLAWMVRPIRADRTGADRRGAESQGAMEWRCSAAVGACCPFWRSGGTRVS